VVTRAGDPGASGRELEHTADLGLEFEAPTLAALFERAALAMLGLMLDLSGVEPRARVVVRVDAEGLEELLRDWLQAILTGCLTDGLAAAEVAVTAVDARHVEGTLAGEPVDPARHRVYTELKGVTHHRLAVREVPGGWWARVIFDV
jgi:SHS2 domain-containing protein